jgi:hypothetical protein
LIGGALRAYATRRNPIAPNDTFQSARGVLMTASYSDSTAVYARSCKSAISNDRLFFGLVDAAFSE